MVGATLTLGDRRLARVEAVVPVKDPHEKTIWRHTISIRDDQGNWLNPCSPFTDGSRAVVVIPGRAQNDGSVTDDPQRFVLACTSDAQGKCLGFGYRPWEGPVQGVDQRAAYNACVRMVRADYGGAGTGYTKTGMQIDVFDDFGVQQADMLAGQDFEAGWTPAGAVCVHHVRVARNVTLAELEARYTSLRGRTGDVCTPRFAREHGAIIYNRSSALP